MSDLARRQTARLLLVRMQPEHFDELHAMHSDPELMATLGGVRPREETQRVLDMLVSQWQEHGFGYWMVYDRASGRFAGRGGLRRVELAGQSEVEVGYAIMRDFWRQGLATELARESIRVAFEELGLRELVCFTLTTNIASQRVMQKAGFQYAGDIIWADQPHVLYRLKAATRLGG